MAPAPEPVIAAPAAPAPSTPTPKVAAPAPAKPSTVKSTRVNVKQSARVKPAASKQPAPAASSPAGSNPYGWESGLWKDPEGGVSSASPEEPKASWEWDTTRKPSWKERFSNWLRRPEPGSESAEPELESEQSEVVFPGGYVVRDGSSSAVRAYTPAP
jgi:hypothetical protein